MNHKPLISLKYFPFRLLIGEAIERYSSLSYDSDAMIRARNTELGDHAIDLSKIITYSNGQYNSEGFPYYRPSENTEFAWVRGSELLSGKPALVPASLIYLNYQPSNPAEMILQAVTSVYGAGRTLWQAIFSGICEVIERDAFSCHWMLQKSGIELVPSSGTGAVTWTALYNFGTFDTKLYRLKMDHDIPVVTAVVYPHSTVGLSVGASCNPDIEVAAEKALIEAFHTWNWCGTIMRRELPTPCADDVSDFEEHVRYYLDADRSLAMQFLSDGRTEPLDTSVSRLKPAFQDEDYRTRALNLARTIEQIGYQSYVIEVTPRELRALDVQSNQSVVEIGCGTGWLLAMLANITGSNGRVMGVETVPFLASIARNRLRNDATVLTGDGLSVDYGERNFDRVIFTASTFSFPTILFDIVANHGKVILPLQNRGPAEEVHLLERKGDEFRSIKRWVSKFVPLISNRSDFTGSFVPIEGCGVYEKLVGKPISSREFTMGAASDSSDLMVRMLPFSSYLSKVEPNFRALSWGADLGRGGSFQSAVFGSQETTCYLVFNKQESSMTVWHKGKLTSYGTSEAENIFLMHMKKWAGLGYPMGSAFGLTISRNSPLDGSSRIENRNDVYLSWRLPDARNKLSG